MNTSQCPKNTWLVVKQHCVDKARTVFKDTGVNITSEGRSCLGAAVGTESFIQSFVQAKVTEWSAEIKRLGEIAKSYPQEAYTTLTHGLAGRWVYLARTILGIGPSFTSLE